MKIITLVTQSQGLNPQEEAKITEFLSPLCSAYNEVILEFKDCYNNFQLKAQKTDQEETLLKLNNAVTKAAVKFKAAEKNCPENLSTYFDHARMKMLKNLSETILDSSEALFEPLEKFKAILKGDEEKEEKKDDENHQKADQQGLEKKEISYESLNKKILAQNQLGLIKESYERVIQGINACLFSSSKGIYSHDEAKILFSFIDAASVQFRSIKQSFPKEFYQEFEKTFENIKVDFENFKSMVPEKYKSKFYKGFNEFDYVLNTITSKSPQANLQSFNEEWLFHDLCCVLCNACSEVQNLFLRFQPKPNQINSKLYILERKFQEITTKIEPIGTSCPKKYFDMMRNQIWGQKNVWNLFCESFSRGSPVSWDYLQKYYSSFNEALDSLYRNMHS